MTTLIKHFVSVIFLVILLIGCNKTNHINTVSELKEYVNDPSKGFIKSYSDNNYRIDVSYKPAICVFNNEKDTTISKYEINEDLLYFYISISLDNKELIYSYAQRMHEYITKMTVESKDMLYLVNENQDTIFPVDVQFVRTFGLSKSTKLLAIYNDYNMTNGNFNFVIDYNFLKLNDLKFPFLKEDFDNISNLNI